ncbi:MAG: hypothetical protein EXR85_07670 [Xanthomonadales bacterium]|nr:hypothetical protein [Xanthomonadales bacterium]
MYFQSFIGRALGLGICCAVLFAANASASSKYAEVAVKYKAKGLAEFQLAEYKDELLECSALAAVHTMIGDNIGEDEGSEARIALASDYWIEVSHDYLSLAEEASGAKNLVQEVGIQIRGLFAEWRRLTETQVTADDWGGWYKLTDQCDTWRPAKPTHAYYTRGREPTASESPAAKVAMSSK